jgi:hypothetical protein
MEPPFVAHIACSSFFLVCFFAEFLWLITSAIRLEHATGRGLKGITMLQTPTHTRRAKQVLPIVTTIFGLAYCTCNLGFRSEGSPDLVGSMA